VFSELLKCICLGNGDGDSNVQRKMYSNICRQVDLNRNVKMPTEMEKKDYIK
jgi:hypothetical protein